MGITLVLAEDHRLLREGTRQLLEMHPDLQVVGEAADGEEAVQLALSLKPDVIVMDVRLPRMNGIEATRTITEKMPGIRVLILSAYADASFVFPLLEAGASGYLLKTSSGSELAEAIRRVHAGETALSPRISAMLVNHFGGRQAYKRAGMAEGLTDREMNVLRLAAYGLANKEIGANLGIRTQTVQVHLRNIFGKLGVGNRSEAVARAIQFGWITLESNDE